MKETVVIGCDKAAPMSRWTRALIGKYALHAVSQKRSLAQAVKSLQPQVLVVNLDLLRPRASRELAAIQQLSPETLIIALSSLPSEKEGIATLKAGVKGYSSQRITADQLDQAIKLVLGGEVWAGRKIVSGLVTELLAPIISRRVPIVTSRSFLDVLSARKREVAMLAIEGAVNKDIANRLNISEATVKAHLSGIFRQLNISRRLELARLFARVPTGN